ncbi:family 1 glycosylhydrolase, partial [Staphylococcus aureus]|uniref:family 1 glycosylhydrolase n=1 Tax=Staphylococcus aureus TaxID=1280 RepID=UPI0037DA73A4
MIDLITTPPHPKPPHITQSIHLNHYYPNHQPIHFYHPYNQHIPFFKQIPFKSLPTSIPSTRIFPNAHQHLPNQQPLPFYHPIFHQLIPQPIQPLLTLSHFHIPLHLPKHYPGFRNTQLL